MECWRYFYPTSKCVRMVLSEIYTNFQKILLNDVSIVLKELIDLGALALVVPGNLPKGCSAAFLTPYETENKEEYNPATGCLHG